MRVPWHDSGWKGTICKQYSTNTGCTVLPRIAMGRDTFQQALRNQAEQQVLQLGKRTPNARQALNVLYRKPMVTAADLEQALGLSHPSVNALLRDFLKLGLLKEMTGAARNRLYVFESYLKLFLM